VVTCNVFENMLQFYLHFLLRGAAIISALSDVTRLEAVSHKLPFLPTYAVFATKKQKKTKKQPQPNQGKKKETWFQSAFGKIPGFRSFLTFFSHETETKVNIFKQTLPVYGYFKPTDVKEILFDQVTRSMEGSCFNQPIVCHTGQVLI